MVIECSTSTAKQVLTTRMAFTTHLTFFVNNRNLNITSKVSRKTDNC